MADHRLEAGLRPKAHHLVFQLGGELAAPPLQHSVPTAVYTSSVLNISPSMSKTTARMMDWNRMD